MPSLSPTDLTKTVVFYGNRTLMVPVRELVLIQREFAHEVCSLVIEKETDAASRYSVGTPLALTWGSASNVRTFQGYVHHTVPITVRGGRDVEKRLKIVCIGATSSLENPGQRIWNNVTVAQIARVILDRVKLSGQVDDHPQGWPTLSQTGMSDWRFLVSLAQRVGWTVVPINTDVQFHDPLRDVIQMKLSAVRLTMDDSIFTFQALSGDATPGVGSKTDRTLFGIDNESVTLFATTVNGAISYGLGKTYPEPTLTSFSSSSANGVAEATAVLDGEAKRDRWYIQARAEVRGNPRLCPGVLVAIDGVNARHDGYWYVMGVEHEVGKDGLIDHLTLGRDSEGDQKFRPDARGRRPLSIRSDPYGQGQISTPPPLLINKVWRAAYSPRAFNAG